MKILFILPTLDVGGTENQVLGLARALKAAGYSTAICCLYRPGEMFDRVRGDRIDFFCLNANGPFDLSIPFRLRGLLVSERFDIVHTFLFDANTWGPLIAKLCKVKFVISGRRNYDDWMRWPHFALQRFCNHFTDAITVNSLKVMQFVVEREKASPLKVKLIHNGIDIERFDKRFSLAGTLLIRKEFGITENTKVLTAVANLKPAKGLDYLLEAMALILKNHKNEDIKLLIVGEGPLKPHLAEYARGLGVSRNVIFTGLRKDAIEILSCAHVFVNSSIREGMSCAILEAMAAGLPVVATDVGGNAEAVMDGVSGFIVEARNKTALAGAVEKLLRDPELAKTMGRQARSRLKEEFSLGKMRDEFKILYEKRRG
ncbi:MAG: glycosyltransferase [Candidatus Omnitrophica bacterium]|nr:glycosyltransferase [Candidatus Omnitrophota bacterium]MDD5552854.1 glycosyltransferase [Candidatus Omnitrophota bacterium]